MTEKASKRTHEEMTEEPCSSTENVMTANDREEFNNIITLSGGSLFFEYRDNRSGQRNLRYKNGTPRMFRILATNVFRSGKYLEILIKRDSIDEDITMCRTRICDDYRRDCIKLKTRDDINQSKFLNTFYNPRTDSMEEIEPYNMINIGEDRYYFRVKMNRNTFISPHCQGFDESSGRYKNMTITGRIEKVMLEGSDQSFDRYIAEWVGL